MVDDKKLKCDFFFLMMLYGRTMRFYGNQCRFFFLNDIKSKITGASQNDRTYICLKREVCSIFTSNSCRLTQKAVFLVRSRDGQPFRSGCQNQPKSMVIFFRVPTNSSCFPLTISVKSKKRSSHHHMSYKKN